MNGLQCYEMILMYADYVLEKSMTPKYNVKTSE